MSENRRLQLVWIRKTTIAGGKKYSILSLDVTQLRAGKLSCCQLQEKAIDSVELISSGNT